MGGQYIENGPSRSWPTKKVHMCKYCGKQFSTKWNAIRHENLFHSNDEPVIPPMTITVPTATQLHYIHKKPER